MKEQRKRIQKIIAGVCLVTILLPTLPTNAGTYKPPMGDSRRGENQPYQHGYRVIDIEN